jgi:hypothetical protein
MDTVGLTERLDAALAESAAVGHRSAVLRAAAEQRRRGGFTTVCAWCGAFAIDAEFFAPGERLRFPRLARVTHGICPDCLEELRQTGRSR